MEFPQHTFFGNQPRMDFSNKEHRNALIKALSEAKEVWLTDKKTLKNPQWHSLFKPGKGNEYCRDYESVCRVFENIIHEKYDLVSRVFNTVGSKSKKFTNPQQEQESMNDMRELRNAFGKYSDHILVMLFLHMAFSFGFPEGKGEDESIIMHWIASLDSHEVESIRSYTAKIFLKTSFPNLREIKEEGKRNLQVQMVVAGEILAKMSFIEKGNSFVSKTYPRLFEDRKAWTGHIAKSLVDSGSLIAGMYEGSAEKLGIGTGFHVYACIPKHDDQFISGRNPDILSEIRILVVSQEDCMNSIGAQGQVKPLTYDEFQKYFFDKVGSHKLKVDQKGIAIAFFREKSGVNLFTEVKIFDGENLALVQNFYAFERILAVTVLQHLTLDTSRFSEEISSDSPEDTPVCRPPGKNGTKTPSRLQTPFTFPTPGMTSHTSVGSLAPVIRDHVRNTTLGWPVVLPSGHLPELVTLQRNQTFFPDYPGAPEVRMSIYHAQKHDKGNLLSEMGMHWPLTDVASDLGYHLSFSQGILGGIEYLCKMYGETLDIVELRKLGAALQVLTQAFILDYTDIPENHELQQMRNRTFLQEIRSTLRAINRISPEYQLRCKTHALPEQFDRVANTFTPQRLGRSGSVLQFNTLDPRESDEGKKFVTEIPFRA